MNHLTATHGELHVRSGCDSPWRDVRGEHGDRRIGVSFCANTAKRAVVPYVAANADNAPRRGAAEVGKPTRGRPLWFPGPRPRPKTMFHSRMAPGSHRRARAARFAMKRPRCVMPPALNISDTHITLCSRRQRCSRAISASARPASPASLSHLSCIRRRSHGATPRAVFPRAFSHEVLDRARVFARPVRTGSTTGPVFRTIGL